MLTYEREECKPILQEYFRFSILYWVNIYLLTVQFRVWACIMQENRPFAQEKPPSGTA